MVKNKSSRKNFHKLLNPLNMYAVLVFFLAAIVILLCSEYGALSTKYGNLNDSRVSTYNSTIKGFYNAYLANQSGETIPDVCGDSLRDCSNYKPYLTDSAAALIKEPRSFDIVSCSQQKTMAVYSSDTAKTFDGDTATVKLEILPYGSQPTKAETGSISMVKQNGTWKIDKFACDN